MVYHILRQIIISKFKEILILTVFPICSVFKIKNLDNKNKQGLRHIKIKCHLIFFFNILLFS